MISLDAAKLRSLSILPLFVLALLAGSVQAVQTCAQDGTAAATKKQAITPMVDPPLPDGTDAARKQMAALRRPKQVAIDLFAAEPQLHSPVALSVDEKGRVFIAEEYRFNRGTEENRTRPFLLEDDLQISTVEERAAMLEKFADRFDGGMDWFHRFTDQIKLLEDTTGSGKADKATVFAADFSGVTAGIASGVLATNGDVYVTCIPSLYRLRDTNGDGQADSREVLLTGFGVNAGFLGHDLHGLTWGPDGRLYFTIGDRGFNVVTKEGRKLQLPRRGAVFRCEPDGSQLEVVHIGLRNPQELAFDIHGNLFADDNNCDKGDHSRLVYVVPGGDSGWSMPFQTIAAPYETGPWHAEKIWAVDGDAEAEAIRPAWVLPPVGKLGAGPSGFAYNGSIAWREELRHRFYMCNYAGGQGIESFRVVPKGASFQLEDQQDFLKPIFATDLDFAVDGKAYVSDFVALAWEGNTRGGRVYTLHDETTFSRPEVAEVKSLFQNGFQNLSEEKLLALLAHGDQQVRLRSQFTLASKGSKVAGELQKLATSTQPLLPRLHALWCLGQIARREPSQAEAFTKVLTTCLKDPEMELRAHAAKLTGEHHISSLEGELITSLVDASPRVQFLSLLALADLQSTKAIPAALTLAEANSDADKYLRHAVVQLLIKSGDSAAIAQAAKHSSPSVRMVALLTMRHFKNPALVQFLTDAETKLVTEAARAIHDLQMDELLPEIAKLGMSLTVPGSEIPEALARRILNANYRLGKEENLRFMVQVVLANHLSSALRREALDEIGLWIQPEKRDRVIGIWRPLDPRDSKMVRSTLEPLLPSLLSVSDPQLQTQVAKLIGTLELKADADVFVAWLADPNRSAAARSAALSLLADRKFAKLDEQVATALQDKEPLVRQTATRLLVQRKPAEGFAHLQKLLDPSAGDAVTIPEKQSAMTLLGTLPSEEANEMLMQWTQRLARGTVPPPLQLEVLQTAEKKNSPQLAVPLAAFYDRIKRDGDKISSFRVALEGGNAERGQQIFLGHRQAQCLRCHKVNDQGGEAGPNLSRVSAAAERFHLLQSLILPSAKIAPGFGTITLVLDDGTTVAGTLKTESPDHLDLVLPDGTKRRVPTSEITDRAEPTSAMPTMEKVLSLQELRDVVEYLSTLK